MAAFPARLTWEYASRHMAMIETITLDIYRGLGADERYRIASPCWK
jgi:hypothetical protein